MVTRQAVTDFFMRQYVRLLAILIFIGMLLCVPLKIIAYVAFFIWEMTTTPITKGDVKAGLYCLRRGEWN